MLYYYCRTTAPASPRPLLKRLITSSVQKRANPLTIGIRREDPTRLWERRCPLTPSAVEELVQDAGVRVLVQDCNRRVFEIHEFERAGATIHPNLSPAHIVLGIKEIPLYNLSEQSGSLPLSDRRNSSERHALQVPRTHMMFSHTGKGQPYNMPLLSKFVNGDESSNQRPTERLIDYELLTDGPAPVGKRVVAFGWFAGAAGAVEGLCASAHDFLSLGVASPFMHLPRPFMSRTVEGMRESLRSVGRLISDHGTPAATGPFVVTVTGNGNVAQGALAMLQDLPHQFVLPEDLPALVSSIDTDLRKVYIVRAKPSHYLVPADGSSRLYDRASYYARPSEWKCLFHERIAPYTSLLINGVGWQLGFPPLMSNNQLAETLRLSHALSPYGRFRTVADISCDLKGGLEFVERSTTIDSPFYISHPPSLLPSQSGVQVMSVDILPSQIPLDASTYFSKALMPYLRTLIRQYQGYLTNEDQERVDALDRATIAKNGELQGVHKWLATPIRNFGGTQVPGTTPVVVQDDVTIPVKVNLTGFAPNRKVLLLGSGMVARPVIEELSKRRDVQLVVASNNVSEIPFIKEFQNVVFKQVDLVDITAVDSLINEANLVISLLPASFHPAVAKLCITRRKHMVTASYISPAMRELHEAAVKSDVLLLNEIGLDPGIDHCSAISLLRRLRSKNKTIKSFISFCGGLPAPEAADVPLGYKFSWSPRGVLNVVLNSARFKLMGEEYNIHGADLLRSYFPAVPLSNVFKFEGIANRDSLPYAETYDLGHVTMMDTVLRGTLRYPGFCTLMQSFHRIGLLETKRPILLSNWESLAPRALASKFAIPIFDDGASFHSALSAILDVPNHDFLQLIHALSWLGIGPVQRDSFPPQQNNTLSISLPSTPMAPIDLLTLALSHQLRYHHNERDMVVLMHEIVVQSTCAHRGTVEEEVHKSTLVAYGTPTSSAMSRTVGLPVAFAAFAILGGHVHARGVHGPTMESVYGAVLRGLEENGLGMKDSVVLGGGSRQALRDELWSTMRRDDHGRSV